jgi:hypothetical protein
MTRTLEVAVSIVVAVTFGVLGAVPAHAFDERNGSLEFTYAAPPDPIGLVVLNYLADKKPAVSSQVPEAPGGSFTTPWTMLFNSDGTVAADTIIVLVNPGPAVTLAPTATLRDDAGVVNPGCTRTLTIGPKQTARKSSRSLFSTCATTK